MRIVIDQNVPAVRSTFARHAHVLRVDGRSLNSDMLHQADALIVRSVTRVGADLLEPTPVGFVGTTTIGTDHLDTPWLEANGIAWASAPGCNADAAAQYTLAMMWLACGRLGRDLRRQTVGIIGRGNVGSRLQSLLDALGIRSVANDPPLAEAGVSGLVELERALDQDIVTLHVPLTRTGPHPTHELLNEARLCQMRDAALLVNSARGRVVDGRALRRHLQRSRLHAALDVWPREPAVDPSLLEATTVATPHVAGYSVEGKLNGTRMIYLEFCDWLEVQPAENPAPAPPPSVLTLKQAPDPVECVRTAVLAACEVERDDLAMREMLDMRPDERAVEFDRLRSAYPARRDFGGCVLRGAIPQAAALLEAIGFEVQVGD